jgi:HEAT repeat protein
VYIDLRVSLFGEVRPEERRHAWAAFLALLGIIAAHTVLETSRDALFLARLPAAQLPWVYLAMAGVAVGLAQVPARRLRRLLGRSGLAASLGLMGLVTAGFWALPGLRSAWGLRALYVWSGLFGTLSALQFWLVLGEIFTITQAKRLYRFVGTGSLLGAVLGGVVARVISERYSPGTLILASALLAVLTALGPALWLRRPDEQHSASAASPRWTLAEARELIVQQPYVTRLAGLVLVSTIALTLGDYVFKSAVVREIPAAALPGFFASFYTLLNVLALLAQLALMGFLLRVLGVNRSLWILPALVFLGAVGIALGGGLLAALLLKGADGTLRYSVHRTGLELLYLPIPDALRARVKPVIDVFGQRGGQAIASLFILSELMIGRGDAMLSVAAAILSLVWIATSAELVPHYLEMFRGALRRGSFREHEGMAEGGMPELDLTSLEALFAGLNSPDDDEVVAAIDVLVAEQRGNLVPALILYHPSRRVVLRALEAFEASARSDFVPLADRLLKGPDAELRAGALRARARSQPDERVLREALSDPSPLVKATAAVGLAAAGSAPAEAIATLIGILRDAEPEARRAVARAIERQPAPAFEQILVDLALSPEADVQTSVARAMGALRCERFLQPLLWMLNRQEVRHAAGGALVAYGAQGLQFLEEMLGDPTLPSQLRRQIPRTLVRFGAKDAARVLQRRLPLESDGLIRFKLLRALNRLAARNPGLILDRALLQTAIERTLEVVFRLAHWREVMSEGRARRDELSSPGHDLLAALLRDKQLQAIERLFRLLGLAYRGENFESLYRGLLSGKARLKSSSRELIEAVLRPPLREAVAAAVDDAPWAQREKSAAPYYLPPALDYEGLLARLVEDPSETVRCLAAHHAGELRLVQLRPAIEARRARESGLFVGRVLEKALRMLDRPALVAVGYAG